MIRIIRLDKMNPQLNLMLVLIVLVAGCANSTSTSTAVRTADKTSSINTAPADVRGRSIVELTEEFPLEREHRHAVLYGIWLEQS